MIEFILILATLKNKALAEAVFEADFSKSLISGVLHSLVVVCRMIVENGIISNGKNGGFFDDKSTLDINKAQQDNHIMCYIYSSYNIEFCFVTAHKSQSWDHSLGECIWY